MNSVHLSGVIIRCSLCSAPPYHPFVPLYLSCCWFCSHSSYLFQLLGMILSISLCKNIHSEDYTKVPKSWVDWLQSYSTTEKGAKRTFLPHTQTVRHWPLFLWHPVSDTTLLRTVRAATQPHLLAIEPLGHLHPASGLFLLQEAELKLSCVTWDTDYLEGTMLFCLLHVKQYYSYLHSTTHWA